MDQTISYAEETNPAFSPDRTDFLRQTYFHLFGAIAAFVALEVMLFKTGIAQAIGGVLASNWLITLGGFILVGWLGSYFASKVESLSQQYLGLGLFIVAEAIIFTPLLLIAVYYSDPSVLSTSIYMTLGGFGVLTAIVVYSGKDFNWLGPFLGILGIAALVAIVGAVIFNVPLGFYFSLAMVLFASATILYETSKVLRNYSEGQHVAAALGLFASVALLFYYVLSMFVSRD